MSKNISDFLPKKTLKAELMIFQAKIPRHLVKGLRKKLRKQGVSSKEFIQASIAAYLNEGDQAK